MIISDIEIDALNSNIDSFHFHDILIDTYQWGAFAPRGVQTHPKGLCAPENIPYGINVNFLA